ncbi:hypothetical protein ILUMI_22504 [Ignelater luminosus]|uniref:Uncharacterized protein n=1 Tax=Ignelater luminosus TaxID=2038154 RepID=A0A8K0CE99_IGNLU|nr:hypothetical protein ILUMI_22504 [Ignelater luminosus]
MKNLKRIAGLRLIDKVRNEIRKRLGVKPIEQKIKENALRWFEHLMRMDPRSPTRRIWKMGRQKKGGRCRSRRKWNDDIGKYLAGMELD